MKKFFMSCWEIWLAVVKWCHREFQRSADHLMNDFRSLRALWNWLFLALYTWVAVWLVLFHGDKTGSTVVTVTGGIVTAIFTNYVWSSYFEKRDDKQLKKPTSSGDEGGSA